MPKFLCWTPGESDPDDDIRVEAYDACEAVKEFAEDCDVGSRHYPEQRTVKVRDGAGVERTFIVESEAVRRYDAYEEEA